MRRIAQVVVLWNLLSARGNRLLKTKDNKRKQVAPKSRIRISLTESVIKQRNQSTDYNSYYSVIHGIDMPNVKDQRREWLARSVLLGARSVTDALVLCIAWFGSVL